MKLLALLLLPVALFAQVSVVEYQAYLGPKADPTDLNAMLNFLQHDTAEARGALSNWAMQDEKILVADLEVLHARNAQDALFAIAEKCNKQACAYGGFLGALLQNDMARARGFKAKLNVPLKERAQRIYRFHFRLAGAEQGSASATAFESLQHGLYLQKVGRDKEAVTLWDTALNRPDVTRDLAARYFTLLIRLKRWKKAEKFLEKPPAYMQESLPRLRKRFEKARADAELEANTINVKILDRD